MSEETQKTQDCFHVQIKKCLLFAGKSKYQTKKVFYKVSDRKETKEGAEIHAKHLEEIKSKGTEQKKKGLKSQTKRHCRSLLLMYIIHCVSEHMNNKQQPFKHHNSILHHCKSYNVNILLSKRTKTAIQKTDFFTLPHCFSSSYYVVL